MRETFPLDNDHSSAFAENLLAQKSGEVQPVFVDFKKDIGYYELTPEIRLNYVPNKPLETKVDVAISNTFGFGGHNASLLLRSFHEH